MESRPSRRDSWVFNSSREKLRELVERQVAFYNEQVDALQKGGADTVDEPAPHAVQMGPSTAEQRAKSGTSWQRCARIRASDAAIYRPFFRQHFTWSGCSTTHALTDSDVLPRAGHTQSNAFVVERGLSCPRENYRHSSQST